MGWISSRVGFRQTSLKVARRWWRGTVQLTFRIPSILGLWYILSEVELISSGIRGRGARKPKRLDTISASLAHLRVKSYFDRRQFQFICFSHDDVIISCCFVWWSSFLPQTNSRGCSGKQKLRQVSSYSLLGTAAQHFSVQFTAFVEVNYWTALWCPVSSCHGTSHSLNLLHHFAPKHRFWRNPLLSAFSWNSLVVRTLISCTFSKNAFYLIRGIILGFLVGVSAWWAELQVT